MATDKRDGYSNPPSTTALLLLLLLLLIYFSSVCLSLSLSLISTVYAASLRYISANLGSVLVTVSISVIIISICIVLLQRPQGSHSNSNNCNNMRQSTLGCPSAHLPHKTLPRALQQQQYQCTL